MMNLKRKAEGSSIANIILIAFAVLLAASVTATTVFLYQSNAKSTKIVNELTSASPSAENLYKLDLLNPAASGATITMSRDNITEEYTMSIPDTTGGELYLNNLKAARGVAVVGTSEAATDGVLNLAGAATTVTFKFQ